WISLESHDEFSPLPGDAAELEFAAVAAAQLRALGESTPGLVRAHVDRDCTLDAVGAPHPADNDLNDVAHGSTFLEIYGCEVPRTLTDPGHSIVRSAPSAAAGAVNVD